MAFKFPPRPPLEGHRVYGSMARANYTLEAHKHTEKLTRSHYRVAVANYPAVELDLSMLAAASEVYQISPDPKDYIIVPIPIVTVGIPNRNLQAFPFEEVSMFDHTSGMLVYQTFLNKPLFVNHAHDNVPESRGMHVDSSLEYIAKYGVWKINVITMWDRSKDPGLVRRIQENKESAFSMGSLCSAFLCSVCGKFVSPDAKQEHKNCDHQKKSTVGTLWGSEKRLAYSCITGSNFFETSYIPIEDGQFPADPTAMTPDVFA